MPVPPKWEVAVVTWADIFPTVCLLYLLFLWLDPLMERWPLLPRIAMLTVAVVAAMTWVGAP